MKKILLLVMALSLAIMMTINFEFSKNENQRIGMNIEFENANAQGEGGGGGNGCIVAVWESTFIGGAKGQRCGSCNNIRIKKCTTWLDCNLNEHQAGC